MVDDHNDDTFRAKKQGITPDDVANADFDSVTGRSAADNANALNQMAQMRAAANAEVGKEMQNPQLTEGMQIEGNVPPAFKKAIAEQRAQAQAKNSGVVPPNIDKPLKPRGPQSRPQQLTNDSVDMRATGSNRLEQLIAGIGQHGMVFEPIELPSKGKFYDGEDGPTDGVIHLRPMTGEEEEILATPRFVKRGQAINMIFNRCMQENYDSSNFLTQDRTYMLIYLRGISYTPEYDVEVKDPDTDQSFATTIDLNGLYVDACPTDFSIDNLEDTLPTTGYKFRYRLAVGRDEQAVQDYRERRAKNFDLAGQADDTLLWRTSHLLEEIEGLTDKLEIQMLLKKLPINDVAYLRTVVNEPPFGVDTKVTVTNPYTLNDFEIDLPLEANFFFPRAKRKTDKNTLSKTQA